jgi:hypothetical protein
MAGLIYSVIASLDGYVADAAGRFDWAEPDDREGRRGNREMRVRRRITVARVRTRTAARFPTQVSMRRFL